MKKCTLLLFFSLLSVVGLMAQRTVTGVVTDDTGEVLIGATVLVKGTTIGSITDLDGAFSIDVPEGSDMLNISFIGFASQDVDIAGLSEVVVQLGEGTLLDEIVVTGYGEKEGRKIISSVSTVDKAAIENKPLTDVNQILQGQAPGVFTTANSGQPGAQQQVRIRGTGSINAGRNPLYVIDGIIMETGNFAQLDATSNAVDVLAQLNPNDIDNITVLKDASATALYGSRGANGVVLITTKRGKAGKTNITAKIQYGQVSPNFGNFRLMTAEEQWNYERVALANAGLSQEAIDTRRPESLLDMTTNWLDEAFRIGETYNAELQASGGNDKTKFFISGGHNVQEGTLIESTFNRSSFRSNIDHKANNRLNLSLNLNGSLSKQNNAVNGNRFQSPLAQFYTHTPMQSAYQADGTLYTGMESDWGAAVIGDNFLYSQPLNYVNINTARLIGKISGDYSILDNLKLTQSFNVDWIDIESSDWDDPTTNDGVNDGGNLTNAFTNVQTYTSQTLLKYFADFGTNHTVDFLVGTETQSFTLDQFSAAGKGFASGNLQTLNSAAESNGVGGSITNYSFLSYLGAANYDFADKYYISASFRRDGSSRFGANNRWANFWSIGGSWIISEEAFLSNVSLVDNLRLRGSYGTSGNADLPSNFISQELYGFGNAYLGSPGSSPTQIANPDITWETSRGYNFGLDFTILNNRIGATIDYYNRTSEDLLFQVPVSSTSGFTTAWENIGKLRNNGLEFQLNLNPIKPSRAGGFSWSIDANYSANRNEILELPEGEDIIQGRQILREGEAIRSFYTQQWAGVNPADGTPLWYTYDDDGNETGITGTYGQADRKVFGNAAPDFIVGLTNTFAFKGLRLSAFFYAAQGHQIYNSTSRFTDSDGLRFGWAHTAAALDYWEQPGDISARPAPIAGGNNGAFSHSTRYLEDASFIRLRNISLSYSLPSSMMQRAKMQGATLYVQGQNLWTLSNYGGLDPEGDEDGDEFFRYPVGSAVTFGVDINF